MSLLKYNNSAYASRLLILSADILAALVAITAATILRFNFDMAAAVSIYGLPLLIVLLVRIISFRWFRTYAVIVRYAGVADILQVFLAVTSGSLLLLGLSVVLRPYGILLSYSILLIDYVILIVLMSSMRLLMPALYYFLFTKAIDKTNIVIIGAGQLGAMTRNVIRQDAKSSYRIVGILDDNPTINNKSLDGIPVYNPKNIKQLLEEETIGKAIFAIQNIGVKRKNELVDLCLQNGLQVLQVPYKSEWINEDFKVNEIKEIQIEDLLDRSVISLDKDKLSALYHNKIIFVTGGAGSIGSELVRQLIKYKPRQLVVIDQAESPLVELALECKEEHTFEKVIAVIADVTSEARMRGLFDTYRPQVIFHAAAYKHVPIMEAFPREAVYVNVRGTRTLAQLAHEYKTAKFVMVSTDKAVNPTNVMGASKRIAEIFIQARNERSATRFITTRFGNVLGSNGSVVPRFKKQIAKGGPVTVTHPDITRYFMTIPEASQLVLEAGAMGEGGEIYLFDMGEPVKIVDLATRMIQLSGFKPNKDIDVVFSGLRPGEKLTEELLSSAENSMETHHPKITRAKVRSYPFHQIDEELSLLLDDIDSLDDMTIVTKMKAIVPEFISNNSIFNVIDQPKKAVVKEGK